MNYRMLFMLEMNRFILLVLTMFICGCGVLFRKDVNPSPTKIERPQEEEISYTKEGLNKLFTQGVEHYKRGEFDSAVRLFSEVLRISPNHLEAQNYLAEALRKRMEVERPKEEKTTVEPKREEEEIKEEKEIPSKHREEEVVEEEIERIPFDEKEIEELLKEKEVEKEEEKEEPVVSEEERKSFEFAQGLSKNGLFREAISEFQNFLNKYPKSPLKEQAIFEIGKIHFKLEEYAVAQESFRKILALEEGKLKDMAHFKLSKCLEKVGNLDAAILEYLRFEFLYPESILRPKVQLEKANIYRKKRDYLKALVEYDKVITNFPDTDEAAEACFNIGDIYDHVYEVRDFKRAVEAYKKLITNYPKSRWYNQARERKRYIEENYL